MPLDNTPNQDKATKYIEKSRGKWDWSSGKLPDTPKKKKESKKLPIPLYRTK